MVLLLASSRDAMSLGMSISNDGVSTSIHYYDVLAVIAFYSMKQLFHKAVD